MDRGKFFMNEPVSLVGFTVTMIMIFVVMIPGRRPLWVELVSFLVLLLGVGCLIYPALKH